ncbi:helix-turn-helix domain-containing protein [Escherichia coli]|uniref:helix-turn-helix domain-containing protein n=1 Tax=Escherichia coli TaxID=562 RepID=UPI0010CF256E|nr:helix-turn-helix domain-containing protein [Escherichia coli]GDO98895.1 transcription regulator [Escherichia coli]
MSPTCSVILALQQTILFLEHGRSVIPAGTVLLVAGHLRPVFQANTGHFLIADMTEQVVARYLQVCTPLPGMPVGSSSPFLQLRPQVTVLAECLLRQLADESSPVIFRDAVALSCLALFEVHPGLCALLTGCIRSYSARVKGIISTDLSRAWMLGEVAGRLCISESLLKKKLQEEQTSFSQLLLKERMQNAAQLLSVGRFSISRVAEQCGYASTSYFIAVFRRYYGIPPKQWLPAP